MANLTSIYRQLFGKRDPQEGNVIDMAEHGRVGGLSTGQGVKYVQILDQSGDVVDSFGGSGSALATVTVIQGDPGTRAWLITAPTLSITGSVSAIGAGGTMTAYQGNAPWLVTFATLPHIAHQGQAGTSAWLMTLATLSVLPAGRYLPTLLSLAPDQYREQKLDLFGNLMVNTNVPLPNSTRFNRFLTFASMASIMAAPGAGRRLVIREMDFSANATVAIELYEDHAGTPARVWGPHYFLPYAGYIKPTCYIPLTANRSLGVNITGSSFNGTLDIRIETENV